MGIISFKHHVGVVIKSSSIVVILSIIVILNLLSIVFIAAHKSSKDSKSVQFPGNLDQTVIFPSLQIFL